MSCGPPPTAGAIIARLSAGKGHIKLRCCAVLCARRLWPAGMQVSVRQGGWLDLVLRTVIQLEYHGLPATSRINADLSGLLLPTLFAGSCELGAGVHSGERSIKVCLGDRKKRAGGPPMSAQHVYVLIGTSRRASIRPVEP